jgi:uncharacterized metal-binding protein YceD (DUF177 family)
MTEPVPEFSRLINVARIPPNGSEENLEAKPQERTALAKRFDLVELRALKGQLTLQPGSHQNIFVTGKIEADVVQRCVVTLEPIAAHLELDVKTTFVSAQQHPEGAGSPYPEDLEEECEIFSGSKIDLGEMAAQYLGINLAPYPRKADAAVGVIAFGAKAEKPQPFAQLAEIKKNTDKT